MTAGQAARLADHLLAERRFYDGLLNGNRQPSYFSHARPGIEETRGVPFAPSPSRSRGR